MNPLGAGGPLGVLRSAGFGALYPAAFTNVNSFPSASISTGPVTVAPSLVSNPITFYAADVRGSVAPQLFTRPIQFFPATIGGSYSLYPSLSPNQTAFYAALVRKAYLAKSTLALLYSGGSANTEPSLSLGGAVSTAAGRYIASQSFTASTIPGIQIYHAARNAIGTGTLSYFSSGSSIRWQPPSGPYTELPIQGGGWFSVGTIATGFLRLYITVSGLPLTDASQGIAIADVKDTLFASPNKTQLDNGVTQYRALYLANTSNNTARNVSLASTSLTVRSSLQIGSSFLPKSTYAVNASTALNFSGVLTVGGVAPYSTSMSSHFRREQMDSLTLAGYPSMTYFPIDRAQNSDGATVDVEILLPSDTDPGGLLSGVSWASSLFWSVIPPNRMVSFWVKRTIPAGLTQFGDESLLLDFTFDLS